MAPQIWTRTVKVSRNLEVTNHGRKVRTQETLFQLKGLPNKLKGSLKMPNIQ